MTMDAEATSSGAGTWTGPTVVLLWMGLAMGPLGSAARAQGIDASPGGRQGAVASGAAGGPLDALGGVEERPTPGVEVAAPADLDIIPVPELSDAFVLTSPRRLLDRAAIEDPFAASALRLGGFLLRPTVEIGAVATTNEDGGLDRELGLGPLLSPGLVASSDWERHQAGVELRGSTVRFGEGDTDENQVLATAAGRLDLAPGTTLGSTLSYNFISEGLAEEIVPTGDARPGVQDVTGTVVLTGRGARFGVQALTVATRTSYDFGAGFDALVTVEQDAIVRATYELSPGVVPFVEVLGGRIAKARDERTGAGRLTGDYLGARAGAILDFGPRLAGELALGGRRDMFEDAGAGDMLRPTLDATLIWSVGDRTNLRLGLASDVEASGLRDAFARATQAGALAWESRVRDDLRLAAGVGVASGDYGAIERDDVTWSAFVQADHDLNRRVAVVARYSVLDINSTVPDTGLHEDRLTVLLRLRR